jgi:CheY-like chemotaxis protein
VYRVAYAKPFKAPPEIESIARQAEYLSAERDRERSEYMPVSSFNEAVNAALQVSVFRAIKHAEYRLRVRFIKAVLEFIVDDRDAPHLLWPKELLVVDVADPSVQRMGSLATAPSLGGLAASGSAGGGAGSGGAEWLPPSLDMATGSGGDAIAAAAAGMAADISMADEFAKFNGNTTGSGARGYVLLIDTDMPAALTSLHALVAQGFAVTLVDDGPKALALTRANAFDCMLIARDLPTLSGLEVSRILRQREVTIARSKGVPPEAARLPIIVLTSRTAPVDLQLYREVGISGCVSKPVYPEALVKTVLVAVPTSQRSEAGMTLQTPGAETHGGFGPAGGDASGGRYPTDGSGGGGISDGENYAVGGRPEGLRTLVLPHIDPAGRLPSAGVSRSGTGRAGGERAYSPLRVPGSGGAAGAIASPYALPQALPMSPLQSPARARRPSNSQQLALAGSGTRRTEGGSPPSGYGGNGTGSDSGGGGEYGSSLALTAHSGKSQPLRPVTGGPHGGRLGQGSGLPIHPHGGVANTVGPPAPTMHHGGGGPGAAGAGSGKMIDAGNDVTLGTYRFDAETEVPYCVMGRRRPGTSFFHLVVVHDFFDTWERYQVFFRRMTNNLPGLRVLLFNVPGQAFTTFRKDAVLNNEYLAGFLQALLIHTGPAGNRAFDLDDGEAPFFLVGYGNGASVSLAFAARYADVYPHLRGLVLVNGFCTPDAHLAGVLHDCINVFSCTPPTRPDLPVYFYARFLFSAPYLEKVGAPLALNMYTAIANPITLEGRMALAQGALNHVNVYGDLGKMEMPIVCVAAGRDSFVKATHAVALARMRGGEARSIRRTLYSKRMAAVISLPCGHEVWQEAKNTMTNLFVQLVTGYHEKNDVAFVPMEESEIALLSTDADPVSASKAAGALSKAKVGAASGAVAKLKHMVGETTKGGGLLLEDRFLEHVVTSMRNPSILRMYPDDPAAALAADTYAEPTAAGRTPAGSIPLVPAGAVAAMQPRGRSNPSQARTDVLNTMVPDLRFGSGAMTALPDGSSGGGGGYGGGAGGGGTRRAGEHFAADGSVLTPAQMAADEARRALPPLRRMDAEEGRAVAGRLGRLGLGSTAGAGNVGSILRVARNARTGAKAGAGGGAPSSAADMPEVQEYMRWRVIRNRRRLQRIEACCVVIQRAWRSYLARTAVRRIVEHRAALDVQRFWRGVMGRAYATEVRRIVFAARHIQRVFRGHRVRLVARRMRVERTAAVDIQRTWKGHAVRKFVRALRLRFRAAAIKIQASWRRFLALKELVRRRIERLAAVTIQRVARGFLARKKAARERERFLFSKSQAQGIEFGRQLLMEHKLRATRLQSEVSMLTREKVTTEEQIQAVLAEIASFEQGVRQLERDMLQLSRADAEIAVAIDEEAKAELRENKLRLDREFSSMLAKIADRREQLNGLEAKLQSLDRARGSKREELRDLERKLVILLEQQQSELQAIRRRQEVRREHLVEDAVEAVAKVMTGASVPALTNGRGVGGGGGGGVGSLLALADSPMGKLYGVDPLTNAIVSHSGASGGGGGQLALINGTAGSGGGGGGGGTVNFDDLPHAGPNRMSTALMPGGPGGALVPGGGGGGGYGGPTPQQRAEAAALMTSTETMMKFGFMAMSMTYFSSLNMVRAMKHVGAANTITAGNPMLNMIAQMGGAGMAGGNPAMAAMLAAGAGAGAGGGGGGVSVTGFGGQDLSGAGAPGRAFRPPLKPGQLPGQDTVDVRLWTVSDVCGWLETLMLGQYKDAFADAAVDGPFLLELTEDDLLNTLGVEHPLHRKKIVASILRLRRDQDASLAKEAAEHSAAVATSLVQAGVGLGVAAPGSPLHASFAGAGGAGSPLMGALGMQASTLGSPMPGSPVLGGSPVMRMASIAGLGSPLAGGVSEMAMVEAAQARAQTMGGVTSLAALEAGRAEAAAADRAKVKDAGLLKLEDLMSWVRHNKGKQVAEALTPLPDGRFKVDLVKNAFVPSFGTEYVSSLDGLAFHVNKTDEHGNTLLVVAAQNNRLKMVQLLVRKGANPDHQNAQGNTAMHFAMAYKFHDLAAWLVDPEKGAASDEVHNQHGLDPYEGLEP